MKRLLLIPLLLVACNGTPTPMPTVTPTVTPTGTPQSTLCALETKVTRLEYTVGELIVILKEFEEVGK